VNRLESQIILSLLWARKEEGIKRQKGKRCKDVIKEKILMRYEKTLPPPISEVGKCTPVLHSYPSSSYFFLLVYYFRSLSGYCWKTNVRMCYCSKVSFNTTKIKNTFNIVIIQWWSTILSISTEEQPCSSLTLNNWTPKGSRHMALEIQFLAWDMELIVAGLNRMMVFQPSLSYNWISNENTDMNKQWITSQKDHILL